MPEGPEVFRTAARLHLALADRELTACDFRWPTIATVNLTGFSVANVVACGKHLLIRCQDPTGAAAPVTVHSHLRMDGSWHIRAAGPAPDPRRLQIRARLANEQWVATGYLLGLLDVVPTAEESQVIGHLGPDLLGPQWDRELAVQRLLRQPEQAIGQALLDQRNLAGIGTFYLAEVLFAHGASPWQPTSEVPRLLTLVDRARRMLLLNTTRAVQATTGDTRPGHASWVYGRRRQPCRRCGTAVERDPIGQGPTVRQVFHCPTCQPRK
jgi:endonuclease VIII